MARIICREKYFVAKRFSYSYFKFRDHKFLSFYKVMKSKESLIRKVQKQNINAAFNCCFRRDYVSEDLRKAARKEALGIAILVVVLAVSPIIIWLVRNAVATIQVK